MMSQIYFKQNIPAVQYLYANTTYRLFGMFSCRKHTSRTVSNN